MAHADTGEGSGCCWCCSSYHGRSRPGRPRALWGEDEATWSQRGFCAAFSRRSPGGEGLARPRPASVVVSVLCRGGLYEPRKRHVSWALTPKRRKVGSLRLAAEEAWEEDRKEPWARAARSSLSQESSPEAAR